MKMDKITLPIVIGVDSERNPYSLDLAKYKSVLVAGMTGMGVNLVLDSAVKSLIENNNQSLIKLLLIGELFEGTIGDNNSYVPSLSNEQISYPPVLRRSEDIESAIKSLRMELERRYALFRDFRAKNIDEHNALEEEVYKLPYIIVALSSFERLEKSAVSEILDIMLRNAAVGIYFLVGTQLCSSISSRLIADCNVKVCFRTTMASDSIKIIGRPDAVELQRGEMLLKTNYGIDIFEKLNVSLPN
ncbi:MAG: hypothetical protein K2M53_11270 [Muribaculaceae bacterium]|nr:hypothetical protein [Muribaculaceae bacterium]